MKADLWNYILEKLKRRDNEESGSKRSIKQKEDATIVDINFALGDYGHIECIKAIILASNRIEAIKGELSEIDGKLFNSR